MHVSQSFYLFEKAYVVVLYVALKKIKSKNGSKSVRVTLKE